MLISGGLDSNDLGKNLPAWMYLQALLHLLGGPLPQGKVWPKATDVALWVECELIKLWEGGLEACLQVHELRAAAAAQPDGAAGTVLEVGNLV